MTNVESASMVLRNPERWQSSACVAGETEFVVTTDLPGRRVTPLIDHCGLAGDSAPALSANASRSMMPASSSRTLKRIM